MRMRSSSFESCEPDPKFVISDPKCTFSDQSIGFLLIFPPHKRSSSSVAYNFAILVTDASLAIPKTPESTFSEQSIQFPLIFPKPCTVVAQQLEIFQT